MLLACGVLLCLAGAMVVAVFSGQEIWLGEAVVVGQVGTAQTLGSAIPHGYYTEYYTSTDLTQGRWTYGRLYGSRICTLRLGDLMAGFCWTDYSLSRRNPASEGE